MLQETVEFAKNVAVSNVLIWQRYVFNEVGPKTVETVTYSLVGDDWFWLDNSVLV